MEAVGEAVVDALRSDSNEQQADVLELCCIKAVDTVKSKNEVMCPRYAPVVPETIV